MKQAEIEQLLPGVFQRTAKAGSPLAALLGVMEAQHAPSESVLARLDEFLDPRRTRDDFVPLLARWLDLAFLLETHGGDKLRPRSSETISTGLGRLRELVASAAELSRWTGTAQGLRLFLQIATGERAFEIREHVDREGRHRPFHLTVVVPTSMNAHRDLVERIIASEKPAYTTCDLVLQT
jgi:phage tail-like protein